MTTIKEDFVTIEQDDDAPKSLKTSMIEQDDWKCQCGPTETCPVCKDEKIAAGISPKFDQEKLRFSLVPTALTTGVAEVLTFGAKKYAANSWQSVENGEERYLDALIRHLEAYRSGEQIDSDSGLSHLSHLACNVGFLMHFEREKTNENNMS